jgi:hypothetical protein
MVDATDDGRRVGVCAARGGTGPTTRPWAFAPCIHIKSGFHVWRMVQDIGYLACLDVEDGDMDEDQMSREIIFCRVY